jgi:hypothetical protein
MAVEGKRYTAKEGEDRGERSGRAKAVRCEERGAAGQASRLGHTRT